RQLPDEAFVLGVDEHTACLLDLAARTVGVLGTGVVTVRRRGRSRAFPSGTALGFADLLADPGDAAEPVPAAPPDPAGEPAEEHPQYLNLAADAEEARFRAALAGGDADAAVAAVLRLDQLVEDWSADPSDERDYARSVLRGMVVELGERARAGLRDPRQLLAPYLEALLELRGMARDHRGFGAADLSRDRLAASGIEVRDTPDGTHWLVVPQQAGDSSSG